MKFEEAIILLKQGKRIKRTSFESIRCISIDHTGKLFEAVYKDRRLYIANLSLSVKDLMADDWVEVE